MGLVTWKTKPNQTKKQPNKNPYNYCFLFQKHGRENDKFKLKNQQACTLCMSGKDRMNSPSGSANAAQVLLFRLCCLLMLAAQSFCVGL